MPAVFERNRITSFFELELVAHLSSCLITFVVVELVSVALTKLSLDLRGCVFLLLWELQYWPQPPQAVRVAHNIEVHHWLHKVRKHRFA